jgi:hypothetical protein
MRCRSLAYVKLRILRLAQPRRTFHRRRQVCCRPGGCVLAPRDIGMSLEEAKTLLSGISQRQGLVMPRRFNSLGNLGIHADAYKVDNRYHSAFLWTRQFISIQQTDSEPLFNLSGLLVTPVHILSSEISATKCDTAEDHDYHQVICANHDPPYAQYPLSPASAGVDRQYQGAVPSRMTRPSSFKLRHLALSATSTGDRTIDAGGVVSLRAFCRWAALVRGRGNLSVNGRAE